MTTHLPPRPYWLADHPKNLIFTAQFEDETVIGRIWYRPIDVGFEIDYIEIEPSLKGKGLSIRIITEFLAFCSSQRSRHEIWLEVSHRNIPALKLYARAGFQQVGMRPAYYQDGSDAVLMSLKSCSDLP